MLSPPFIRENPDKVAKANAARSVAPYLDALLRLDSAAFLLPEGQERNLDSTK